MNGSVFRPSLALAVALRVLSAASAYAADTLQAPSASSDEASEISEIVVTARRVEERAQDVPISMTVFNQQQLTDRNIVTAGDLAAYTPSMSVDNEFGGDTAASPFAVSCRH